MVQHQPSTEIRSCAWRSEGHCFLTTQDGHLIPSSRRKSTHSFALKGNYRYLNITFSLIYAANQGANHEKDNRQHGLNFGAVEHGHSSTACRV
jgi:hypothetical protein